MSALPPGLLMPPSLALPAGIDTSVNAQAPIGEVSSLAAYGDSFLERVIALCLKDPDFLTRFFPALEPRFFSENEAAHSLISIIRTYFEAYSRAPDIESVRIEVGNYVTRYGGSRAADLRVAILGSLDNALSQSLDDADFVTDKVVEFARRQALKACVFKFITALEKHDAIDPDRMRTDFEAAMSVGQKGDAPFVFGGDAALTLPEILRQSAQYSPEGRVPTCFSQLNVTMPFNGLGPGELLVVSGPPGRGKSAVLANMGRWAAYWFAAQKDPRVVLHITLELKATSVALMYASLFSGLAKHEVSGDADGTYAARITPHLDWLQIPRVHIQYFSPSSITIGELRWWIASYCASKRVRPGLIIIDYADKLRGAVNDRDNSTYNSMGTIYDEIIAIGDKFGAVAMTGSQINREWSMEELIDMRGFAGSWLKAANAHTALFLCQTKDDKQHHIMRVFVGKNREGASDFVIMCKTAFERAFIAECTADEIRIYNEVLKQTPAGERKTESFRGGNRR